MSRWLITNARLVNEGETIETDVRIERGRIDRMDGELSARPRETVVNAHGRFLLPGMIDTQVHFREPGLTHKGNIATESRAAVAGGVTSFLDLPDTRPPTTTRNALADKFSRAGGRATANYSFYLGAESANLDEIRHARKAGACGVCVGLGSSGHGVVDDGADRLAERVAAGGLPALIHGEDTAQVEANAARALARYGNQPPSAIHAEIHSRQAAGAAIRRAVELANTGSTLAHAAGLSTIEEIALARPGPLHDKPFSTGVSLANLYFMEADYAALGHRIKALPAIQTGEDRAALRRALRTDHIDIIASGHAPHLLREKGPDYISAAAGMPLVQFALPVAWSLVAARALSPEKLVEKTAHNPARRFGVAKRGFVREGYWADLTMIDTGRRCEVDKQTNLSHCGWSPFAGRKLPAIVAATWVNGKLVWRDGLLTGQVPGARLKIT